MPLTFQTPTGETHTVDLTLNADGTFSAVIGEKTFSLEVLHQKNSSMLLVVNGQRYLVHTVKDGNQVYVGLNGKTISLEKTIAGAKRRVSQAQAGDLTANMPGQVMKVLVSEGDSVQKGDTLLVLEAMKMEMRIKSPFDGYVKAILCAVGDAVERGQHLVEVEADS